MEIGSKTIVFKENIKALLKAQEITTTIVKDVFNKNSIDDKTIIDFNINEGMVIQITNSINDVRNQTDNILQYQENISNITLELTSEIIGLLNI